MSPPPNVPPPRTSTIPYTPTAPGWTPLHPRPLRLSSPHTDLARIDTPPLPCPSRAPVFHTTTHGIYRLSTHLIPAAFPRLIPDIPHPVIPTYTPGGSPRERREKIDAVARQAFATQTAYEEGRLRGEPSEKVLWNYLNRYLRTTPRQSAPYTGITLFLVHAHGFHKETWETMLRVLLDTPAGEMVDEVWALDAVHHGDSAVINAKHLSGIFDWLDSSRDIANFLLHYLPEDVEATVLPTRLPCLPASVTKTREECGYHTRKLVVVGHSFGGCTSLRVALHFPKLFSSLVLMDPIIHRPETERAGYVHGKIINGFVRRDHWSSREEALQLFQKSPFFGAWDPDVLRLYVDHGLIDDPEGGVRLKMPGLQEGISAANRMTCWETWEMLERLDEVIALRWVVPEQPLSTKELTFERVWRRPANSTNVVFHFSGHLIVQEAPRELAHDISEFLRRNYGSMTARL